MEAESKDFKDRISPAAISALGAALAAVWSEFPEADFVERATAGLSDLELKQRVIHVADALAESLPSEFAAAAAVIGTALDSPDFDGWIVYCVDDYVARYGIGHPEIALPLMGHLTTRWSCEFAIRPFIEAHPEETFAQFDLWIESEDEHHRRLVSEGSRPRLPWGGHLKGFIADPSPTVALLDRLVDDPSLYVRRSVANHLNDIAKDHPDLAVETGRRWLDEGGEEERRRWIVGHAMRSLVKAGDPGALSLIGYDPDAEVEITGFTVSPDRISIGEAIEIGFELSAEAETPVMVDYLIHHAGVNGTRGPKAFKLKKAVLPATGPVAFQKSHRIREVSVRRIHPGPHLVEIQVNGRVLASTVIEVV